MTKFDELFAQYNCGITDEEVKNNVAKILAEHAAENNNPQVWRECLHFIDLTTLNGDDTTSKVQRMAEAVNNFPTAYPDLRDYNVATICVYPAMVETVKKHLSAPGVGITSVAGGFPASQTFLEVKVAEVALAVAYGATNIDVVLSQGKFLEQNYQDCLDELREQKDAARDAHFKVILETGALGSAENIYKASILAMSAGADFIKTSTGKIKVNATPEATYIMCRAIKDWYTKTGRKVSYKPAGGVSSTEDAVIHYTIVKEVLGQEWLNPDSFRFGASSLANKLLTSICGSEQKYF